jgi:hypothetical protein
MLIQDIKAKSRELIEKQESKLKYVQPNFENYSGSIHSYDLEELLQILGKVAFNILGKKDDSFVLKDALKKFNNDLPNTQSLLYILKAYRHNDDANLGLENYLNSNSKSTNALRHFEAEFNNLSMIFKYNVDKEYLTSPLKEYTKDMFAYKWCLCMVYLMIFLLSESDAETIPYKTILSDLTGIGVHRRCLDDKDYDYLFSYNEVMYSLGGIGLVDVVNESITETTYMGKLAYLLYHGLTIGLGLDTYFKIANKLLEVNFYLNDNEQAVAKAEQEATEELELTDEDRKAMLMGHIKTIISKAKENNLDFTLEDIKNAIEE